MYKRVGGGDSGGGGGGVPDPTLVKSPDRTIRKTVALTKAEYEAIPTKDEYTLYNIVDDYPEDIVEYPTKAYVDAQDDIVKASVEVVNDRVDSTNADLSNLSSKAESIDNKLTEVDAQLDALEAQSTAKWPILNATETRSKSNESSITALQEGKVDKVDGFGLSQENYTTEEKTKLSLLGSALFLGTYDTEALLLADYPASGTGGLWGKFVGDKGGCFAWVYVTDQLHVYSYNATVKEWTDKGQSGADTAEIVKQKYESNPDTNAYTNSEKAKLAGLSNYDDQPIKDSIATKADKSPSDGKIYVQKNGINVELKPEDVISTRQVEYLVNTNTTGVSNLTAFANSREGVLCPAVASYGTKVVKRVKASRSLIDAKISIQFIYKNETIFFDASYQDRSLVSQADKKYGISIDNVIGSTDMIDVIFNANGAYPNKLTYGADGLLWNTDNVNTHKWRIRVEWDTPAGAIIIETPTDGKLYAIQDGALVPVSGAIWKGSA